MGFLILAIELLLIVLTYIISSSLLTAGVALMIVILGYTFVNSQNPVAKAFSALVVFLVVGFIYAAGSSFKLIAKIDLDGFLVGMNETLFELGSIITAGTSPPFNITGDGPVDLFLFFICFASLEIIFRIIGSISKCRKVQPK